MRTFSGHYGPSSSQRALSRAVFLAGSAVAVPALAADPAATSWTGSAGAGFPYWSTSNNWDGAAPENGGVGPRDLYYGSAFTGNATTGQATSTNDLTDVQGHKIVFQAVPKAAAFTLDGNAITLSDYGGAGPAFPQIDNASSALQTVDFGITFSSSIGSAEIDASGGDLRFGGTITLAGSTALHINSTAGKTLTFASVVSGGGGNTFDINGNNTVVFAAANTYAGDTDVNAGKLQFSTAAAASSSAIRLGAVSGSDAAEVDLTAPGGGTTLASLINPRSGTTGTLTVASHNTSGTNTLTGGVSLDHDLTVGQAAGGTLSLNGPAVDVKGKTLTFDGGGTISVSPAVSDSAGSGAVALTGGVTVTFNTAAGYTGGTTIGPGSTLVLRGSGTAGKAAGGSPGGNVANNGTLTFAGDGTQPYFYGVLTGGGTTNVNRDVTFQAASPGYSGPINIAPSTQLTVSGGSTGTGAITIGSNGYLDVFHQAAFTQPITGAGELAVENGGNAALSGANGYGVTDLQSGGTVTVNDGGRLGTGRVLMAPPSSTASLLVFDNSASGAALTVANAIGVGNRYYGGVAQDGTGKTTLNGDNQYAFGTAVNAGTLVAGTAAVGGSRVVVDGVLQSSATGTGRVTVGTTDTAANAARGTLAGTGGTGDVVVNRNGVITAGTGASADDGIGTLTTGAQTWNAGGTYAVKFDSQSATRAGYDQLSITGLRLVNLDGSNEFNLVLLQTTGDTFAAGTPGQFRIALISGGVSNGATTYASNTDVSQLFALDTSRLGVSAGDFSVLITSLAGGTGQALELDYTPHASPEPGAIVWMAAAIWPLACRRRRKSA